MKNHWIVFTLVFSLIAFSLEAFAAHPLITDDAGTVGKGHFQMELNSSATFDEETEDGKGVKESEVELETVFTYGLTDEIDLVATLPYAWSWEKEDGVTSDENGIADASLEMKWRFFEADDFSLAVKPGISLPTGDKGKGLGTGEVGYSAFFIASQAMDPWAFHLNLGYMRNENDFDERRDLWHVSLATEWNVAERLTLVGNVGAEANPDRADDTPPVFALAGFIYSVAEHVDVNAGFKAGLTRPEADFAVLTGVTFTF
ncbi:MAG: transporter [Acidobacteriota bacterium]